MSWRTRDTCPNRTWSTVAPGMIFSCGLQVSPLVRHVRAAAKLPSSASLAPQGRKTGAHTVLLPEQEKRQTRNAHHGAQLQD